MPILSILGFVLFVLTRQLTVEFHHFVIGFSGVAGWSLFLYVLSAAVIFTLPTNGGPLCSLSLALESSSVSLRYCQSLSCPPTSTGTPGMVLCNIPTSRRIDTSPGDPALSLSPSTKSAISSTTSIEAITRTRFILRLRSSSSMSSPGLALQ